MAFALSKGSERRYLSATLTAIVKARKPKLCFVRTIVILLEKSYEVLCSLSKKLAFSFSPESDFLIKMVTAFLCTFYIQANKTVQKTISLICGSGLSIGLVFGLER